MSFNSLHFLVFFPIVVAIYFRIDHKYRWIFLLAGSYYFYMCWEPEYALLIMFSTVMTYYTGIKIADAESRKTKKNYLVLNLAANLSVLFLFKYFNFFSDSFSSFFSFMDISYRLPELRLLLPVGISFYTFQALSYTVDVYRGEKSPENHFGYLALYISFFPQLVAGPIERSTRLLPQFYIRQNFIPQRVISGLQLMMWGLFKKVVVADRLAAIVNQVYNKPDQFPGILGLFATYLFSFQILCDFSGYSDIAIGAARVFGISLMDNFKQPYFSKSIGEFWRRWHISLSTWFKDYMYFPLGGSRVGIWRWYYNIMLVFIISGLWHGASWNFVLWGALHGFYLLFGRTSEKWRISIANKLRVGNFPRFHNILRVLITYHLVLVGWIFFRANSFSDAIYIFKHMFSGLGLFLYHINDLGKGANLLGGLHTTWAEILLAICGILSVLSVDFFQGRIDFRSAFMRAPSLIQCFYYYLMVAIILVFGVFEKNQFIYFQF